MLFYLTTLNLEKFLNEDARVVQERENNRASLETLRLSMQELHSEWLRQNTIQCICCHEVCKETMGIFEEEI